MPMGTAWDLIVTPALGALVAVLLWLERRHPLRARTQSPIDRLKTNAATAALAMLVMRAALLPSVLALAGWADRHEVGLARLVPVSDLSRGVLAFVLMDYATYLWHRANHAMAVLWRFHAVHHTDLDLDVSTAFRFHFGEMLLSIGARSLQILIIGVGPSVALVWEAVELAGTAFHHGNVRLPIGLERALNRILVTPRMHGIHHSVVESETNSNWSVIFSWWDRVHGTARLHVPQDAVTIGLPSYRDPAETRFVALLTMPFEAQRPTWIAPESRPPVSP